MRVVYRHAVLAAAGMRMRECRGRHAALRQARRRAHAAEVQPTLSPQAAAQWPAGMPCPISALTHNQGSSCPRWCARQSSRAPSCCGSPPGPPLPAGAACQSWQHGPAAQLKGVPTGRFQFPSWAAVEACAAGQHRSRGAGSWAAQQARGRQPNGSSLHARAAQQALRTSTVPILLSTCTSQGPTGRMVPALPAGRAGHCASSVCRSCQQQQEQRCGAA